MQKFYLQFETICNTTIKISLYLKVTHWTICTVHLSGKMTMKTYQDILSHVFRLYWCTWVHFPANNDPRWERAPHPLQLWSAPVSYQMTLRHGNEQIWDTKSPFARQHWIRRRCESNTQRNPDKWPFQVEAFYEHPSLLGGSIHIGLCDTLWKVPTSRSHHARLPAILGNAVC